MLNDADCLYRSMFVFKNALSFAEMAAFSHPEDEDWEIYGDKEYLASVLARASPDTVSTRWELPCNMWSGIASTWRDLDCTKSV